MRSDIARYGFSLIHWVLAATIFILLGLGWYIEYAPPTAPSRSFLLDLHISLGLTGALLISIQIFLQIILRPGTSSDHLPQWQRLFANVLYTIIYVSLILILISGYLETVLSGMPIRFWEVPLPVWGVVDVTLATFFGTIHGVAALVFVALILAHLCFAAVNIFKRPGSANRLPQAQESHELVLGEAKSIIASKMAQGLANNLRLFGWIEFWLQFVLAFISALLLAVASSGRAFSPSQAGFGDAIYWGGYGFFLLCFTVLLAFYYTRVARKVVLRPEFYFTQKRQRAFWSLRAGVLIGFLKVFVSFVGVGLSLSLLIAKTVSQPPGIAITDPNKIIRALDVFVLLVNCILLMAHFIGSGISLWLGIQAAKSRLEYKAIQ